MYGRRNGKPFEHRFAQRVEGECRAQEGERDSQHLHDDREAEKQNHDCTNASRSCPGITDVGSIEHAVGRLLRLGQACNSEGAAVGAILIL